MELSAEISYPHASTDDAFALVVDAGFRKAVCEATHALEYSVDIDEHDDGGATVALDRTMPAELPDFARKIVGDTLQVRQTERWSAPDETGGRHADLLLEIKGQPATFTGTAVLEPAGVGCHELISGTVRVAIPFIGKKLEPEVAKGILAAVQKEQEIGSTRLG